LLLIQSYFITADTNKPLTETRIFFYQVIIKESLGCESLSPLPPKKGRGGTCMNKTQRRLQSCWRRTILGNEGLVCYFILCVSSLFPVLRVCIRMLVTVVRFWC